MVGAGFYLTAPTPDRAPEDGLLGAAAPSTSLLRK